MKKVTSIILLGVLVILASSFKATAPILTPSCVPNYTMVEIPDPPTCYALKIVGCGYMYDPDSGNYCSEYIVYSPDYTSIWNMEGKYDYDYGFTASVYIKWYSYSSWTFVGMVSTSSGCATKYTYPEEDYTFLSKLEFYYSCIQAP